MNMNYGARLLLSLTFLAACGGASAQTESMPANGRGRVVLHADPGYSSLRVAPPARARATLEGLEAVTATLTINYLPAGPGKFGDQCAGWTPLAQAAFTYAANIWASQL